MVRSTLLALVALSIGVSASAQTVSGSVTYRERMLLPPTSVVEVTLEDVSRADAPAQAIASTRIETPGASPIAYILQYDPSAIHPGRRYAVRAKIYDRDRLMFTSTDSYQVLTQGHDPFVDVVVRQVGTAAPPPGNPSAAASSSAAMPEPAAPRANAAGIAPAPATLDGLPASFIGTVSCDGCQGTRIHLNLFDDDSFFMKQSDQGRANVRDDMGSWALSSDGRVLALMGRDGLRTFMLRDATALRLLTDTGSPASTAAVNDLRKAARFQPLEVRLPMQGAYRSAADAGLFTECTTGRTWVVVPEGAGAQLQQNVGDNQLSSGESILFTVEGRVAAAPEGGVAPSLRIDRVVTTATEAMCVPRFAAAPLQRTNWRLTHLGGQAVAAPSESRNHPYLIFDDDTTRFSGAGGCNRLVGTYDINGPAIALGVAGTMMACPQQGSEASFTAALESASRYRIVGQMLSLFAADGAELARFEASGQR